MKSPIGYREHLFGLVLAVVYIAMLMATANDYAMTRDESFYVSAAEQYGRWFEALASDPADALTRETVDQFWVHNHEHPSLAKSFFAWSNLAQEKWQIFDSATKAHRFPGMVSAGLLLWLVFIFGARVYGRPAGVFAAVALAAMPRFFYHSHLNCFDVPIVLMITWTVYCYWRSLENPWWAIWFGIAFGLSLETKHNTWILPGILLIHWAFVVSRERRRRRAGRAPRASLVPHWLIAMLLIAPLLFVALWPWMWFETFERIGRYIGFHINHEHYVYQYFGTSYWQPPFPVALPFVLTWYTVPAITVLLALAGIATRARALLPPGLEARWWPQGQLEADSRATDVLFFGALLAPMVVIAMPSSPIFGGTKHWFTAYPYLALFAGVGFRRLSQVTRGLLPPAQRVLGRAAPVVLAGICLAPAVIETAHSHPHGLTHYAFAAGGVPGAADDGMNRQFWGYTHGALADWFRETMPDGGSVYLCDATWVSWHMAQRDGLIPQNVRAVGDLTQADYAMVHHEEHFAEVDFQAWMAFGSVAPVEVLTYDGVPLVSVYENPRVERRRAARAVEAERGSRHLEGRPGAVGDVDEAAAADVDPRLDPDE